MEIILQVRPGRCQLKTQLVILGGRSIDKIKRESTETLFEIHIKSFGKILLTIPDVHSSDGILKVKSKVEHTHISIDEQRLVYAGNELRNWLSLQEQEVKKGSILVMFWKSGQIFVKTWSGSTICLDIEFSNTIESITSKVQEKTKI